MISVRSGKGFGDSLYLQAVARHLVHNGERVEVCTCYPDVFRPLRGMLRISPFRRHRVDRVAHYTTRKHIAGTDQFRDCCISAGLREKVELRLDWTTVNESLVARVRSVGMPIVILQMPRLPMGRADNYGLELLPDCETIQRAIDLLKGRARVVQIGAGEPLFRFSGIDLDLANTTSVSDVIDVVAAADAVLGYCSFIVPLAESLGKPALLVWSCRGLSSQNDFIRTITPAKIINRRSSSHAVMDDCSDAELAEAANALCEQVRMPVAV